MWWSWTLAAIGVTGLYLTTRRDWRGYLIGAAVQALWIAYAIVTTQWGFIGSALVYGAVNVIGLRAWRKAEPEEIPCPPFTEHNLDVQRITQEEWRQATVRQLSRFHDPRSTSPLKPCRMWADHLPHMWRIDGTREYYECEGIKPYFGA